MTVENLPDSMPSLRRLPVASHSSLAGITRRRQRIFASAMDDIVTSCSALGNDFAHVCEITAPDCEKPAMLAVEDGNEFDVSRIGELVDWKHRANTVSAFDENRGVAGKALRIA
jgi:hypothetical protein